MASIGRARLEIGDLTALAVAEKFEFASTVAMLRAAARGAVSAEEAPTLIADAGVENVNAGVDELIVSGLLRRVLALRDVSFSNSLIEAWWHTAQAPVALPQYPG